MPSNVLFPLKLQIARRFVGQALQGMPLDDKRGATVADEVVRTLMFIDVILTEEGDLIAEVALQRRLDQPRTIDLEVKLASDWPLPAPLHATLSWNTHRMTEAIDEDGIALFPNISFNSLTELANDPTVTSLDIVLTPA